ncbi:MAG: PDZ domain-containing protein [Epsilonproteobacteria bacterium]|nr:PDZ domain-containing protein [Campylobacterota bacterium]
MNQKSNNLLHTFALFVLLPIAVVKLLWSGVLFFLDKDAMPTPTESEYRYHYSINPSKNLIGTPVVEKKPVKQVESNQRIKDIKLKGTFNSKNESFIVLEDNLGTTFLYKNEKYIGYKLVEVYEERAVLQKNGQNYDIVLESDDSKGRIQQNVTTPPPSDPVANQEPEAATFVPGMPVELTRKELDSYVKNPNKIWKNIRIQELRREGQLQGFRVNYVKKGSFFEKSGLKSGDVIKSIDGKEIKSLADVMKYYSNVETLENLSLSVSRGDEELELEFNVN